MTQDFHRAVAQLTVDADGVDFTGFLTNARVDPPPVMVGEVWMHVRADATGRFADGHRIQTSPVVEVHSSGESMWVVTESGSRYGIISFAPLGRRWFSDLIRRKTSHLNSPLSVDLRAHQHLAEAPQRKALKEPRQQSRKRHPLRPPSGDKLLEQHMAFFTKAIAELKSHGTVVSHRTLDDQSTPDKPEPEVPGRRDVGALE